MNSSTPTWLQVVAYRLGQVRQQLGFVAPLSAEDKQEVQRWLPASALALFDTMADADQQHSLRVCRGLLVQGCVEHDMLAAALLHDVGKAQGRVPFWTRPVIVLGKRCAPHLLARTVLSLSQLRCVGTDDAHERNSVAKLIFQIALSRPRWRSICQKDAINRSLQNTAFSHPTWQRALSYAWWHAEIGADLATNVGLSERAVLYIRTHHEAHGPAAALHHVDEVS